MPTDTFAITTGGDDGCGRRIAVTWAGIDSGGFDDNPFGTDPMTVAKGGDSVNFVAVAAFMRFDTSSLPDDATITGASLLIYIEGKGNPDSVEYAADYYDYGGSPSTGADFESVSSGNCIATINPNSLTVGIVNTISLTGLAGINKTGITGIRMGGKTSSSPSSVSVDNFIDMATFESANQEPRLQITWSPASQAQVLMPHGIAAGAVG